MGAILLLAGNVAAQPQRSPAPRPTEPIVPDVKIDQRLDEQVPLDLTFRDEEGRERRLGDYFNQDKPVVLVLAYYRCPRLCSLVLNGVSGALRRVDYQMGKDYEVVTVSIDPREKPDLAKAKKEAYVEQFARPGADVGWHFLTGDEPQIKRLAEAVGFNYSYDAARDEYAHASGIMVLTPAGKVSRYFYGMTYVPRDVAYGLEDASAHKIGSPLTQPLRLLCFTYDPTRGQYTMAVMNVMRLGGAVTILVLGTALALAWRRERRRRSTPAAQPE